MDGMVFVLVIMFCFVLPIVMAGIWTDHKKKMAQLSTQLDSSEKHRLEQELVGVKKRLEVLEAIVTDKKYQLNEEFAALKLVDK
ncbi:hypothetical protein [Bowmanella dokdonensis]|nr:hypothetical protein [Bowmanella dokdonensis]